MGTTIRSIALIGEYVESFPPHAATAAALRHSAAQLDRRVQADWVSTAAIDTSLFERYQGAVTTCDRFFSTLRVIHAAWRKF
jgi:CTP synthase (UTP-ammonia lyase)